MCMTRFTTRSRWSTRPSHHGWYASRACPPHVALRFSAQSGRPGMPQAPHHAPSNPPRKPISVKSIRSRASKHDGLRRYGALAASLAERARHGASYNPLSKRTIQNPYPVYARLRNHSPVHRSAILGSWLISRYEDVLAVARDQRAILQRPAMAKRRGEPAPARAPTTTASCSSTRPSTRGFARPQHAHSPNLS